MFAGIGFILVVWQIISLFAHSQNLMPSPGSTLLSLVLLYKDIYFFKAVLLTILRGLGGILIALIISTLLAVLSGYNQQFRLFITPTMITLRSTPVISFILLAIVWFTPNQVPVFIAILTMLPVIYSNITEGILQVDPNYIKMSKVFRVSLKTQLKHLYWPSIQPYFYAGLSTALGFGWRAIIVGEVLAHPDYGIGTSLKEAQSFLEVDKIIAWSIVGILISAIFDKLLSFLRNQSLQWQSA